MHPETKSHAHFPTAFWLVIFATLNALLMTLTSLTLGDWSASLIGKFYLVGAMATQFVAINFGLALALYLVTYFMSSVAWRLRIFMLVFAIAQLIIIVNLKVYALYHFHLNGMVINLLTGGALLENLSFSPVMWLSVAAVVLMALLLEYFIAHATHRYVVDKTPHTGRYAVSALVAMIALQLINGFADAFSWKEISLQNRYIPWMQATTMRKQLARLGFTINKDNKGALDHKTSALHYPLAPLTCTAQTPPNIVMLVVDSLRADMLAPEIMPSTSAIAKSSLNFSNHFSTGSSTRYGLFGLMYGLPGSYWNAMLTEERGSLLFDITQSMHYEHAIYGSAKLTFPEFDRTVFSQLRNQLHKGSKSSGAENDIEIAQQLIARIQAADKQKPFFGFAFFDAPHGFSLPKDYPHSFQPMLEQVNYMALNNDYDASQFFNRYKTTARFVDDLIQTIYQALADSKLLDNTIVIITSDHGQEFNETKQNYWGHNSNFSRWQTKVPMIIHWPGVGSRNIAHLSSHEDVIPTLMQNALGCDTPLEKFSTGKNLLGDLSQSRSLLLQSWTERAIKFENKLYVFNEVGNSSTLDDNYHLQDDNPIPAALLQENLQRMSQFLKK